MSKYYTIACCKCSKTYSSLNELLEHLETHKVLYCRHCLKYKKLFLYEQSVYSFYDLSKLWATLLGQHYVEKHKACEICKKVCYNEELLERHLTRKHPHGKSPEDKLLIDLINEENEQPCEDNKESDRQPTNYYITAKIPKQYGNIKHEYAKHFPAMAKSSTKARTKPPPKKPAKKTYDEEFPPLSKETEAAKTKEDDMEFSAIISMPGEVEEKELPSLEAINKDFANMSVKDKPVLNQGGKKNAKRKKKKRETYLLP